MQAFLAPAFFGLVLGWIWGKTLMEADPDRALLPEWIVRWAGKGLPGYLAHGSLVGIAAAVASDLAITSGRVGPVGVSLLFIAIFFAPAFTQGGRNVRDWARILGAHAAATAVSVAIAFASIWTFMQMFDLSIGF